MGTYQSAGSENHTTRELRISATARVCWHTS